MARKIEDVDHFRAESAAGSVFEIIEFQEFTEFKHYQGTQLIPGRKFWRLSNGTAEVSMVCGDDDAFDIISNGRLRVRQIR